MRGLFSTGIADVLLEEGITVDGMVGVSAGACLCCNYKMRAVHQLGIETARAHLSQIREFLNV